MPFNRRFAYLFFFGLLLTGCSPYAKVTEMRPHYAAMATGSGELAVAAQNLRAALTTGSHLSAREKMGRALAAADILAVHLQRSPHDDAAIADYNFALDLFFSIIREQKVDQWGYPLVLPSPSGNYTVTTRPDAHALWKLADCELIPSHTLAISGAYLSSRTTRPGIGSALVTRRREAVPDSAGNFVLQRTVYGVTAVARFNGHHCEIAFEDPLVHETVTLSGRTFPLAADYTAPIAIRLTDTNFRRLELLNLFRPGDRNNGTGMAAGIVTLQPFDPNKTTVLVVHGLFDSPATWSPLINAMRGDPEIRKHYQFWFFGYPSGYPYPYSAALLRQQLDMVEKRYPQHKKMILIGHSMGGLLSRLMITDPGDRIWREMFGKPPGLTPARGRTRKILSEMFLFKSRPEVGRVIFISTPHRGSNIASGFVGPLVTKLIKVPGFILSTAMDTTRFMMTMNSDRLLMKDIPTSITTLSPSDHFVKIINTIPIKPGVPYHSIIGDRGRGDTPNSSDGAVPYWSSHLDGAVSECIVPSGHRAHQNPEAIEEVRRILLKYRQ